MTAHVEVKHFITRDRGYVASRVPCFCPIGRDHLEATEAEHAAAHEALRKANEG